MASGLWKATYSSRYHSFVLCTLGSCLPVHSKLQTTHHFSFVCPTGGQVLHQDLRHHAHLACCLPFSRTVLPACPSMVIARTFLCNTGQGSPDSIKMNVTVVAGQQQPSPDGMSRPASDYKLNAYQSVIAVICMQHTLKLVPCTPGFGNIRNTFLSQVVSLTEVTHLADKSVVC